MALESGEFDFAGKIRLPLPKTFSGIPAGWEEWSWNFKSYISTFDSSVKTLLDDVESRQTSITDADLNVTLDTGDLDQAATNTAVNFGRKLHYLSQLDHGLSKADCETEL